MLLLGRLVLDGGPADASRHDVGSEASTRDACQRGRGWRGGTSALQLAERRQRRRRRVMEGEADLIRGSKFCGPKFQGGENEGPSLPSSRIRGGNALV